MVSNLRSKLINDRLVQFIRLPHANCREIRNATYWIYDTNKSVLETMLEYKTPEVVLVAPSFANDKGYCWIIPTSPEDPEMSKQIYRMTWETFVEYHSGLPLDRPETNWREEGF